MNNELEYLVYIDKIISDIDECNNKVNHLESLVEKQNKINKLYISIIISLIVIIIILIVIFIMLGLK